MLAEIADVGRGDLAPWGDGYLVLSEEPSGVELAEAEFVYARYFDRTGTVTPWFPLLQRTDADGRPSVGGWDVDGNADGAILAYSYIVDPLFDVAQRLSEMKWESGGRAG